MSLSPSRNPAGQHRRVGVVELHPQRAADVADRRSARRAGRAAPAGRRAAAAPGARSSRAPGACRLASSSVITTTGRTTSCSSKRSSACGSASRTLVSRTYVRRCRRAHGGSCQQRPRSPPDGRDTCARVSLVRGPGPGPTAGAGRLVGTTLHASTGLPDARRCRPSSTTVGVRRADPRTPRPARSSRRRGAGAQAPKRRSRARTTAARAGSRPCGSPASRPRRSRTRECALCQSRKPDSRCSPEVRITRSGSGWPRV